MTWGWRQTMLRRRLTSDVQDAASGGRELARRLANDRKFRREVAAAVRHAALARQRSRRRAGVPAALALAATDNVIRRELTESWARLRSAQARVEKQRRRRRRRLVALLTGLAGAAAVIKWRKGKSSAADGSGSVRVIQESIEVDVPVSTAYNQWTQFEEFPDFMEGVEEVRQLDDTRLHWVASIAGKRAEWDAKIIEQEPDTRIVWESIDGKQTRGTVTFDKLGDSWTRVRLTMSYTPEGIAEKAGSAIGLDRRRIKGDLQRFKELIESRGVESGAWRGEIQGGVETA